MSTAHNILEYMRSIEILKTGKMPLHRFYAELNRLVETWIETKVAELRAQDGHDNQPMASEHMPPDRELGQELE